MVRVPHDPLAIALTTTTSRFARSAVLAGRSDVASATWRIASMLDTFGPLRPSQIAQRERTSRATTTAVIARLEEQGLVARTADPADARAFLVELTDKGARALAIWRGRVADALSVHLAELSASERQTLQQAEEILQRLITQLEG